MIFLQAEPIPQTFMEKLADQGLSVMILAVLAWYLLKRLKENDTKLAKYIEEDRQKMIEVIEKNTEAFRELTHKISEMR